MIRVNKVKFIPTYYLSDFVATYLLPVVISVPLYSRMCWALRPQHFPKKSGSASEVKCSTLLLVFVGHSNASLPSDSLANRRRVIKMLAICVVIFFVCYTPTAIHIILSFVHWTYVETNLSKLSGPMRALPSSGVQTWSISSRCCCQWPARSTHLSTLFIAPHFGRE